MIDTVTVHDGCKRRSWNRSESSRVFRGPSTVTVLESGRIVLSYARTTVPCFPEIPDEPVFLRRTVPRPFAYTRGERYSTSPPTLISASTRYFRMISRSGSSPSPGASGRRT